MGPSGWSCTECSGKGGDDKGKASGGRGIRAGDNFRDAGLIWEDLIIQLIGMEFLWNEWNLEHATQHGVSVAEAESLVEAARRPFPEYRGDGKWLVQVRGMGGRFIQVIYLVEESDTIYVIHARPLTESEIRRYRRRLR